MMEQKGEGLALHTVILIVIATIVGVSSLGIFIGNRFFWQPAEEKNIVDRRFEQLAEMYRKNPKSKDLSLAYALALSEMGKKSESEKMFKDLVKKFPKDNAVLVNYAVFQKNNGDIDEAKKVFEKVLSKYPYFVLANVQYGILLREKGEHQEALKRFDNALKIEPAAADILVEKAKVYIAMKEQAKARDYLNKALRYVPDYAEAKQLLKEL